MRSLTEGECLYHIWQWETGDVLTLDRICIALGAIRDLADGDRLDAGGMPIQLWQNRNQIGFFVGDTSHLIENGWIKLDFPS